MNLVDQRCSNHALREAAVQCPSCKRFFCRECVTEHQGRMICVCCVTGRLAAQPRAHFKVRWTIMAATGVVLAWLLFYYLGLTLTRIPSEFHAEPESFVPHNLHLREGLGADRSRWSRLQRNVDSTGLEIEPRLAGAVSTGVFT